MRRGFMQDLEKYKCGGAGISMPGRAIDNAILKNNKEYREKESEKRKGTIDNQLRNRIHEIVVKAVREKKTRKETYAELRNDSIIIELSQLMGEDKKDYIDSLLKARTYNNNNLINEASDNDSNDDQAR